VPSADKRARKKENARAAREQREAAEKRRKRIRSTTTIAIVGAIFIGVVVLLNVAGSDKKKSATPATTPPTTIPAGCEFTTPKKTTKPTYKAAPAMTIDTSKTYVAQVDTTCGTFDITLDVGVAPKTANSFVFLAKNHFYDGLTFHRLVKDFVIQGGDPKGDGTGGPGYTIKDEPVKTAYKRGTVAMARTQAPDSVGSQFFIVLDDKDGDVLKSANTYQIIGNVSSGMETADAIFAASGGVELPENPIPITKATVANP